MWSFSFFLCFIATCCYTCDERLYFVISDVSVNWPVWLHLLQELYLILDTGTGLKLLYHHLGGAETRINLAQQNLKSIHRRRSKLEESRPQFIINSINTHLQSENVKLKQWERCMSKSRRCYSSRDLLWLSTLLSWNQHPGKSVKD